MKTPVVIVDDHELVADALQQVINKMPDFEVIFTCRHGEDLINKLNKNKNLPHIVLLDIQLPVMDGYETCFWLKKNHPTIKTLAITSLANEDSLKRMISNGALGYLVKNTTIKELEFALQKVSSNEFYYPDWATKIHINRIIYKKYTPDNIFTKREKEFLIHCVSDISYKEMARLMQINIRTVESIRGLVAEKTQIKTRVGLAVFAIKHGYVPGYIYQANV